MSELTIGFVGLGTMGWPLAANLHAAGFALVVRDIDGATQARFAVEHPGALAAASPDALAAADIVVTMLPNGAIVADALLDPRTMIDIINASTGRSFISELVFAPEVLTGRYGTGFALGLMAKDVRIAQRVAAAAATDTPVIALTDERWAKAPSEFGPAADQSMAHQAWWSREP